MRPDRKQPEDPRTSSTDLEWRDFHSQCRKSPAKKSLRVKLFTIGFGKIKQVIRTTSGRSGTSERYDATGDFRKYEQLLHGGRLDLH
jgi:hypothetical protein